jgi:hypothetical protein
MQGSQPGQRGEAGPSPHRSRRLWTGAALTAAILCFPGIGASVAYDYTDDPVDGRLVLSATLVAASLAGAAWAGLGVFRLITWVEARERSRAQRTDQRLEDPELVRAVLARHDVPCPACGYNLRGLSAGSCPECHRPITLHLAGADPLRPLVWVIRLAIATSALSTVVAAFRLAQLYQLWPYYLRGAPFPRQYFYFLANPVVSVLTLLAVGVAVVLWKREAVSRWSVLLLALGGLALSIALDAVNYAMRFF